MDASGPAPERHDEPGAAAATAAARDALRSTVDELRARGVPDEAVAVLRTPRALGPIRRAPVMVPTGRAWRLGVLLLTADGGLAATGRVTRALEPTRSQDLSAGVEARKDARRAAARGRFREGEAVHWDVVPLALEPDALVDPGDPFPGRLTLRGQEVVVQWGPTAGDVRPLAAYLRDRLDVLELG